MVDVKPVKYPLDIPGIDPKDIHRTGPRSRWAVLTCYWKEISEDAQGQETHILHEINPIFDLKTKKVYRDDSLSDLRWKFTALVPGTPLFLAAKTVYHLLFPLSLPLQIYLVIREDNKKTKPSSPQELTKKIIIAIGKNFADIVRTPIYAVAMTVVSLVNVILSSKPKWLYKGRIAYGEMLLSLHWGKKKTITTYAPCMLPLADLSEKGKKEKKRYYSKADTLYDGPKGSAVHALNNLARKAYRPGEISFF